MPHTLTVQVHVKTTTVVKQLIYAPPLDDDLINA